MKFYQTFNPYNKNDDGSLKSETEIRKEIEKEKNDWINNGIINHQKCFDQNEPPYQYGKKLIRVNAGKYEYQ